MEPVPTSFIPKQTLITRPPVKSPWAGLFMLIGVVAFLSSLLVAGGAFVYKQSLIASRDSMDKDLAGQQKKFEPATLRDLQRLDNRLNAASELLGKHITLLPFFEFIQNETLKSVRFKTFSFSYNPASQKVEVRASGEAKGFASIALQSDKFVATNKFREFFFSDLNNLDVAGNTVVFNFSATVDPELISYNNALASVISGIEETPPITLPQQQPEVLSTSTIPLKIQEPLNEQEKTQ